MRFCPDCKKPKPLKAFGVNKARKDGIHLYCKHCANEQTLERRELIKAMRAANKAARIKAKLQEHEPEQRVLFAIKEGARTQTQIKTKAKVYDEQLGLALVQLMLVDKKVISRVNGVDEREYFVAA